jgi:hypothetical protein
LPNSKTEEEITNKQKNENTMYKSTLTFGAYVAGHVEMV